MQWIYGLKHLIQQKININAMARHSEEYWKKINPKNKLILRFDSKRSAFEYLIRVNVTTSYPIIKFVPLNLTFQNKNDLLEFLFTHGIVREEIDVSNWYRKLSNEVTIIDTAKIYEVEESVSKYLLNYKYYSINEVADMLSFSRPTIYKFINDGNLNSIRINGQMRIKHSDLTKFINKENQK